MKGLVCRNILPNDVILHFLHKIHVAGVFLFLLKTNVTKAFLHQIHVTRAYLHEGIGVPKYFTKRRDFAFST
jgi:hypothetical protein